MRRRTFLRASLGAALPGILPALLFQKVPAEGEITQTLIPGIQPLLYTGADLAFGTTISVQVLHHDRRQAEQAIEAGLREAKKVDLLMSLYRADSQLAELNRLGSLRRPDPHLLAVMREAQRLAEITDGAFDATVQPLWRLHADAAASQRIVTEAELARAREIVNWRRIDLDPDRITLSMPGMAVTLNGIAQGYASDLALAALRDNGIEHALVDIGEFGAIGQNASRKPWTLGVRHPREAEKMAAVLKLDGRSMATSGDYETSFRRDFSAHHIFDPATGNSPPDLASVTVMAPTGLLADGLSTAMFVAGPDKALALAADHKDVAVLLIDKHGRTWMTPGLPLVA